MEKACASLMETFSRGTNEAMLSVDSACLGSKMEPVINFGPLWGSLFENSFARNQVHSLLQVALKGALSARALGSAFLNLKYPKGEDALPTVEANREDEHGTNRRADQEVLCGDMLNLFGCQTYQTALRADVMRNLGSRIRKALALTLIEGGEILRARVTLAGKRSSLEIDCTSLREFFKDNKNHIDLFFFTVYELPKSTQEALELDRESICEVEEEEEAAGAVLRSEKELLVK